MIHRPANEPKVSSSTWIGLFVALFGVLVIRQVSSYFWPTPAFTVTLWKESLVWLCAIVLLIIIRRGERLPLTSIGIGTSLWWKSLLWGLVLAVVCGLIGGALVALTHFNGGAGGAFMSGLPLWLVTLIVLRAGVVEELFYRGYAIERLQALGLNRYLAVAIPLVIFSVAHWTGGWANIVIALALGAVLSASYLWRRDLIANMIGHFIVDFATNVLPRLFGHS
jgi:membrane protease YdiL (CAAX protease family)